MPQPSSQPTKRRLPEILAPAGSPAAFRAAVAAGADAIYLSGRRFGARKFAQNFTGREIDEAIGFAHSSGVSVYVTVNTLVHDRELADVADHLLWLYSIGVDAVLLQDLGVAAIAREIVPDLPLHASTQMTIHNTDGVRWAAEHGFSRVVLARELSLAEIGAIAGATVHLGIGLEVFAHGALCYCYSGQCLLSSVIGGRSGNRGMCAQPCRKPYTLVTGSRDAYDRPVQLTALPQHGAYPLSTRDLCTYQHLVCLVQSPIVSLKIEGRMKSPEYVAIVVSTYRRALDAIAAGSWAPNDGDLRDLTLAFNRGFTAGYLLNETHARLMGRERPDNRGLLIGMVIRYHERSGAVTVRPSPPVHPVAGDGVVIRRPDQPEGEAGFSLNTPPRIDDGTITFPVPRRVTPGSEVYLTASIDLASRAKTIIEHAPSALRPPVPIDLAVRVMDDGTPLFKGIIDAGGGRSVKVEYRADVRLVPARTRPLTPEWFRSRLKKTGGTPFAIRTLSLQYPGSLFAPASELNRMRREFFKSSREALIVASRPSPDAVKCAKERHDAMVRSFGIRSDDGRGRYPAQPVSLALYADRIEVVTAAARAGCDTIYFEPYCRADRCTCQEEDHVEPLPAQLSSALTICRNAGVGLAWKFPRIMHQAEIDTLLPLIDRCLGDGLTGCMVENIGAAYTVRHHIPGIRLFGSIGLNIFNHGTVRQLAPMFYRLTLSPELSFHQIADLASLVREHGGMPALELIVQGNIEAIVSESCLIEPFVHCMPREGGNETLPRSVGMMDSTGRMFPVLVDGSCRTHILNAVETCLIDHLPALFSCGIGSVAIDARGRTGAYAAEMVDAYRQAIAASLAGGRDIRDRLNTLKKRVKRCSIGGITAGHFVKGLKESDRA